jgi:hypothetical protein
MRANLLASFARTGPAGPAPILAGDAYLLAFPRTPQGWRITGLASTPHPVTEPAAGGDI